MPVALATDLPEAETLIELVRTLSSACSQTEITRRVTRAVRTLTGADGATFVLKEGDSCFYADDDFDSDLAPPQWRGQRFPLASCVSGWAMDQNSTVTIPDVWADDRISQSAYRPSFVRSLVVAPVHTDAPVAAIGAYWAKPVKPRRQDIATIETIAHAAALALQNLELTNSLRTAVASKSRLLAAVGHDLRQPLQSLALFASVLEVQATTPMAKEAATRLNAAVDRMANLLGSILALADLDSGSISASPQPVGVDALLAPLEAEMAPEAAAKGIKLVRVPCSAQVLTDAGLMTAILRNLTANAIRYTERGKVLLGARRLGDSVGLLVGDTGIGIDPGQQTSIFEDFYQIDNSARDFSAGTGVGLSIVRRLVDILGHRIGLRSAKGRGSLFTVTLPTA
ncbi:MAG TPA: GAF domain-containing sensor histidine kinase [Magnetospirillum sp.]|nr:GAF domain-containing sensor histidine kinase [Magnetospirillum sp.]